MPNLPSPSVESRDRLIERLGGFQPENIALADLIHTVFSNFTGLDPRLAPIATTGVTYMYGESPAGAIVKQKQLFVCPVQYGHDQPVPDLQATTYNAIKPAQAGLFYAVDYSSSRTDQNIYAYTANVKRTGDGTGRRPIGAQFNAYDLSTAGTPNAPYGAALEAWSGDHETEPQVIVALKGLEAGVISQHHNNDQPIIGINMTFKNRKDAGDLLHGSIGNNKFNFDSRAVWISAAARSGLGEFCGWYRGIYIDSSGLDASVSGGALGIDMGEVPSSRLLYAMLIPKNSYIGLAGNGTSTFPTGDADIKMRYLDSGGITRFQISAGSTERVGFDILDTPSCAMRLGGNKVVGVRETGWSADTGTAKKTANATYTGTAEVGYTQATIQTLMDKVRDLSQTQKSLKDALILHGLIGT